MMGKTSKATDHDHYRDADIRKILHEVKTIAMVGASPNWNRPSFFAMKYLQQKGYRVIPVNPVAEGQIILGEPVVKSLADIKDKVDMVDVFRKAEECVGYAQEAVRIGAKVLWLQLGVRNDEAARIAEEAGLKVVMNRCPKIEYARLSGELGWNGINSGVISSKKRKI
ncbi:MAG: CoA-binding protein [Alphaproteobacteria bacterium]|nr:CoA-binding protein [Alphaproteobacteria bacterium]